MFCNHSKIIVIIWNYCDDLKSIVIIQKYCDDLKVLWLLKKIVIKKINACNKVNFSLIMSKK